MPELDASVVWYGNPPAEYVDAKNITKPMMGHWSMQDEFFSPAGVDELEKKLKEAGVDHEFHRYDAKHAFANPQSDSRGLAPLQYHPEAAEMAWKRSLEFFKKHLT